jgi:hypothetical protein
MKEWKKRCYHLLLDMHYFNTDFVEEKNVYNKIALLDVNKHNRIWKNRSTICFVLENAEALNHLFSPKNYSL